MFAAAWHTLKIMMPSDSELIEQCLHGNQRAWDELIARYSRLVYSIPLRKGFSADDADDVFQTVFAIMYQQLPTLRRHESLPAWLITITQRQCLRLQKPAPAQVEFDEGSMENAAAEHDETQVWERQQLVQQALRQLDPRCRELLTALFLDAGGERYKAIAARLQIPIGSIGPVRARCFKKLEAILQSLGMDGRL